MHTHTHNQIPRNAGGACCHHSRCHAAASGRRAPLLHVAATRTPRSRAASSSASDLPMLPMLHFLARHVLSAPCAMIIVSGLVCCVLRLTIRTTATRCWTSKTATHSLTSSSRTSACTSPDASSGASARCDGRRVPVSYCAYAGFCARRRWCWAAALPMDPVRIAWTDAAWTSTATRIRVLGDIRHHARGRRRSRRHFSDGLVGAAPTPTLPALPACPAHNCPIAVVPMRLTCQCAMASHCCGAGGGCGARTLADGWMRRGQGGSGRRLRRAGRRRSRRLLGAELLASRGDEPPDIGRRGRGGDIDAADGGQ